MHPRSDYTDYVGGGKSVISEAVSSHCWWCEIKMSKRDKVTWTLMFLLMNCKGWWHWHCQPDKCDRAHTINTSQRHSVESVTINIHDSLLSIYQKQYFSSCKFDSHKRESRRPLSYFLCGILVNTFMNSKQIFKKMC